MTKCAPRRIICPKEGLADVKSIMELLKLKPENKPASVVNERLSNQVEDIRERIKQLKSFDAKEEINLYCDQLEKDVIEETESFINQSNLRREEMLKEINEYRHKLLAEQSTETQKAGPVMQELDELSDEVKELDKGLAVQVQNQKTEDAAKKLKTLKNKLMAGAFNNRFLRLGSNQEQSVYKNKKTGTGSLIYADNLQGCLVKGEKPICLFLVSIEDSQKGFSFSRAFGSNGYHIPAQASTSVFSERRKSCLTNKNRIYPDLESAKERIASNSRYHIS